MRNEVLTFLVVATFVGYGFGAAGYYEIMGRSRPSKPIVSPPRGIISEADKELEAARLKLEAARINAGMGVSAESITMDSLPEDLKNCRPEHVKFLRERAEKGNDICQQMLATLYAKGIAGIAQNYEIAAEWSRKAYYNKGNDLARKSLRFLIKKGLIQASVEERTRLGL